MTLRGKIVKAACLALTAGLLLGGCTGDDERSDAATAPTPGATAPAPSTSDSSGDVGAEDEAAVVAVLRTFWRERIRVESSGDFESADFDGILTDDAAEPTLERYDQLATGGFHRVGKPALRDYRASVDGDTAVASVCVNEDEWDAEAADEVIELEKTGWYADTHRLERRGTSWIIVGDAPTPDAFAC